jgi:chemotaxis regulatin CheY-phosphate phosphatase CheZ
MVFKPGKVIGQLNSITQQTEQGSGEALVGVENAQAAVEAALQELERVKTSGNLEGLSAIETKLHEVSDYLFGSMAAFQFQDITSQKLQKVMSILSELNDYLNDLLGVPEPRPDWMAPKHIEQVDLVKDKQKAHVDSLVKEFHEKENSGA